MALMKAWFSAETEQQQWERCSRLLQTSHSRKIVQVAGIREAVAELVKAGEADEQQMFKALAASIENEETEELIKARVNQPRATAESSTPECLKKLRPSVENCVLVYQIRAQSFQSYYPKPLSEEQKANPKVKKHFSTSRTFGTKWTKLQALRLVVQFLWTHHRKLKRDCSSQPSDDDIAGALKEAEEILSGQKAEPAAGLAASDVPHPAAAAAADAGDEEAPALSSADEPDETNRVPMGIGDDSDDELSTDSDKKAGPKPSAPAAAKQKKHHTGTATPKAASRSRASAGAKAAVEKARSTFRPAVREITAELAAGAFGGAAASSSSNAKPPENKKRRMTEDAPKEKKQDKKAKDEKKPKTKKK
ncbi:HMCN1 [Symbiodinium sp. CCMP2592]|nr:HMCN1 [Symbiodinium sp. CCMP2592]